MWEELSENAALPIYVVKVEIDEGGPRPAILTEARNLIHSSMLLDDDVGLSYPLGVIFDPNGVVVQATFGKERLSKKADEILDALARKAAPVGASTSSCAVGPREAAPGVELRFQDLRAITWSIGVGAVAGGAFAVAVSYEASSQLGGFGTVHPCGAAGACSAKVRSMAERADTLRQINTAGWIMAGVGLVVAVEATIFMLQRPEGTARVAGKVGAGSGFLTLEGNF